MASIYDLKIAPLVAEGKKPDEIARTLGMRESDVRRLVARTRGHQFSRSFVDFTDEEIAEKTGRSVHPVRSWRNGRGLKPSSRQVKRKEGKA